MNGLLSKLLKKRGITDVTVLSPEEKAIYDTYERTLSKEKLTVDDLEVFLNSQISIIEAKWRDQEYTKKADLIPYHTCYKVILGALKAPQAERAQMEAYLHQLIQS